jgi:hypothetical protein
MKRTGAPQRKTELRRGAPLRRAGLGPAKPPARRAVAQSRAVRRDTGPTKQTRALAWERDSGCCVACGRPLVGVAWKSLQHRDPRGMGGTSDPAVNELPNLIYLCGSATSDGCHFKAEQRDPEMNHRGYWLENGQDPAATPIFLVTEHYSRWVLATRDGRYIETNAPEAAA